MKKLSLGLTLLLMAGCVNQNGLVYQGTTAPNTDPYGGTGGYQQQGTQPAVEATPAPVATPSTLANDTVVFPDGGTTLTTAAKAILDAQSDWLVENDRNIQIQGHSDEQGTRDYNIALGSQRAAAVRDYLVLRGVPRERIEIISYGKERPAATCSNESCWSQNRRAVTVVL